MFVDSSVSWRRTLPYGSSRVEIIVYCSSEGPELILIRILYSCGGEWRDSWRCLLGPSWSYCSQVVSVTSLSQG